MKEGKLAPVVIGHNAFFGVDHLSAQRGAERAAYFEDPKRIVGIISVAAEQGAGGLMMSTHERAKPVADILRRDRALGDRLVCYPLLPYAQKYITKANESGLINVVQEALGETSFRDKMAMGWNVAKGILGKDTLAMIGALIRLEMTSFRDLIVGAVFLHDVLTDLLLSLELRPVFEFYIEEINRSYGATGGFATKNLPLLLERFAAWELPSPTVMTHFNKVGYHMNPSREACEAAAATHPASIMAMGTLASGFLKPDDAYRYLAKVPRIESVVVGVSSEAHILETFTAIRESGLRF